MNKTQEAVDDLKQASKIQPNNPLYFADLGYIHIINDQPENASQFIAQVKNLMATSDPEKLNSNFNISQADLKYINSFLTLQDHLESKDVAENNQQNVQNIYDKFLDEVENYKNEENQKFERMEKFLKGQIRELEQKINEQTIEFNKLKERVEKIESSETLFIENKLKWLKQPQNENKKILAYFGACALIQTGLVNSDSVTGLDSKSDYWLNNIKIFAQMFSPLLGYVPIVGNILESVFNFCDHELGKYQDKKFKKQVDRIMAVLKLKAATQSEREKEVQIAAFTILDRIKEQDIFNNNFLFKEKVEEIARAEICDVPQAGNLFWQLGIENSLKIIKSIIIFSEEFLKKQDAQLRDIIIEQSLKNCQYEAQQKQKIKQTTGNRCCMVQ